jgi:hypothetical protein
MFLFTILLFFVLSPGILFTIPKKSSKKTVAIVHGLLFAIIWCLIYKCGWVITEGFAPITDPKTKLKILEDVMKNYYNDYEKAHKEAKARGIDYKQDPKANAVVNAYVALKTAYNFAKNAVDIAALAATKPSDKAAAAAADKSNLEADQYIAKAANAKAIADKIPAYVPPNTVASVLPKTTASILPNTIASVLPNTASITSSSNPVITTSIISANSKGSNAAIIASANALSNEFANFAKALSSQ